MRNEENKSINALSRMVQLPILKDFFNSHFGMKTTKDENVNIQSEGQA